MIRAPLLLLLFLGGAAIAHEGDSPEANFYRSLGRPDTASGGRIICCGPQDCVPTVYRITPAGYEVPTEDVPGWEVVPPEAVIHVDNPIGQAVVCHYGGAIRCFIPNAEG